MKDDLAINVNKDDPDFGVGGGPNEMEVKYRVSI
jgi:hypothetical protein